MVAEAYDRRIQVINKSSAAIVEIYMTNVGRSHWGRDLLGRNYLPPGMWVVVNPDDGQGYCRYDLLAINEHGEQYLEPGINICEISSWTLYD
jgi:thiamine monophosphate kinase